MQVAYIKKVEKTESPRRQRRKMQLVSLIEEHGGASQVARESGTPKSHLSAMVAGRRGVGDELAKKLEGIYAKPEGWFDAVNLADGRQYTAQSAALIPIDLENNPDYPSIRRARFKLSAGASGFAVEYEQGDGAPMVFGKAWYAKRGLTPDKLFAVQVANGSMEPGLHHGDTVVVNTEATEPKDGSVFAVNYEGELCIKRLIRDAGQWWLSSDNNDQRRYPRKVCGEGVFLIGEIVHKQSERI